MFTLLRLTLLLIPLALAHPMLEMSDFRMNRQTGFSGTWGADRIRALRHIEGTNGQTYLASSAGAGYPGNIVIRVAEQRKEAIPFVVTHGNFLQVVNSTSMLYVNVVNTTLPNATHGTTRSPHALPQLKLKLSTKKEGVRGQWSWTNMNVIQFELASGQANNGWFYSCPDVEVHGELGVFIDFNHVSEHRLAASSCVGTTLHSFGELDVEE
ncbi:hypothetical protein BOTBODRAFT_44086 [Botryobasidium botryosum FD-172 SS1]|uniref:Uncharacterized protein n=1 Tax=Botryobasidium botryosum (strain FD-172 SS1) TaxID=930990 RepID=A0A067MV55_BOTB1|nr:hypothetical protein BOTBODRAFT_44086 [Botryobasidium botryosum FD-172 SS1]